METPQNNPSTRETAVKSLAIVGFVALVGAGIYLAIYSARYVPTAINNIGEAAVAVGSIFHSGNNGSNATSTLTVASTTPPVTTIATSTTATSTTSEATTTKPTKPSKPVTKPGTETSTSTVIGGGTPSYYGLPDLAVQVVSVGYLATTSASSFVPSATAPAGTRPAIHFIIKNVGTNVSGSWDFSALIPTQGAYVYHSVSQQSLNPGDSIEYTLGFSNANLGSQTMQVTANPGNTVKESSVTNNVATANITVLGQ